MLFGVQLVVFFCSSILVVLFDTQGISGCLNTLFLLSPHLCLIIGFTCDLFVVRNDSCKGMKTSHGLNKYMFLSLWKLRARVEIP